MSCLDAPSSDVDILYDKSDKNQHKSYHVIHVNKGITSTNEVDDDQVKHSVGKKEVGKGSFWWDG